MADSLKKGCQVFKRAAFFHIKPFKAIFAKLDIPKP